MGAMTKPAIRPSAEPARELWVPSMEGTGARADVRNMQQLVQLRWIAVVGQVAAIAVVHHGLGIALPLQPMLLVLAGLAGFNLASQLWWRGRERVTNNALLLGLLVDVAALTAQLHLSGGITNPFVFLYLLQVVLGAVLLHPPANWILVAATALAATTLSVVDGPVAIPAHPERGLSDPWVAGLLVCFALNAVLLVVFVGRIGRIIRQRDARLAALRQRAAEEEHIVRMGLLASGAAHELGTPLSTLSVILGDWRQLPTFASEPELLEDVEEMRAQVLRCKSIVTGILQSAGETRGEAPVETTVNRFLDTLVEEWQATRPVQALDYENRVGADVAIVTDTGVKQMIGNVLDNALEASPGWLSLDASRDGDDLLLRVRDRGPGFDAAILRELGTPYTSSKGKPGGGLGLFLSMNVARTLGGTLTARNRDDGAEVTMRLPLSALTLDDEPGEP